MTGNETLPESTTEVGDAGLRPVLLKRKKKTKRPTQVEDDNPQMIKRAKMTLLKPSSFGVVLGVPTIPNVPSTHHETTTVSSIEPREEEFNDGFDPLYMYPSHCIEVSG